jgi:hypothetical protein
MRTLVSGEQNMLVLEESSAKHVAKGVVFLVESEGGAVGGACRPFRRRRGRSDGVVEDVRVSAASVTFFSPSPRRKSSNLSRD